MEIKTATEIRKNWSVVLDSVLKEGPVFFKRTRDHMFMCSADMLDLLLSDYDIVVEIYSEEVGYRAIFEPLGIDFTAGYSDKVEKIALWKVEVALFDFIENWSRSAETDARLPYIIKAYMDYERGRLQDTVRFWRYGYSYQASLKD